MKILSILNPKKFSQLYIHTRILHYFVIDLISCFTIVDREVLPRKRVDDEESHIVNFNLPYFNDQPILLP